MARLCIRDLEQSLELNRTEMRQVFGGKSVVPIAGGDRFSKIVENSSPFPTARTSHDDRLFDSEMGLQLVRLY